MPSGYYKRKPHTEETKRKMRMARKGKYAGSNHPNWKGGKIQRICQVCGGKFMVKPHLIKKGGGKYCSRECLKKGLQTKKLRKCMVCGEKFYVHPSRKVGKFCSRECYHKICKGKDHHRWNGGKIKRICLYCGEKLETWVAQNKVFCSKECRTKWHRGKNNPNWKGGVSEHYQNHKAERRWHIIKKKILERDNYTCQVCGVSNIRLHVHHIIPWEVSYDDSPGNLITVCQSCHNKIETNWQKPNCRNLVGIYKGA